MDGIGEQIDINMNISSLCIRDDGLSKNQAEITYMRNIDLSQYYIHSIETFPFMYRTCETLSYMHYIYNWYIKVFDKVADFRV